ncbi:hypothetical protein ACFV7Q_26865 [Streptomyces sp. NPDC059851]|uniref:hypothetical protein n=1 Tax=Streptomyces sp. NPDC059851 TaxID=3346971 RepID=UPI00366916AA
MQNAYASEGEISKEGWGEVCPLTWLDACLRQPGRCRLSRITSFELLGVGIVSGGDGKDLEMDPVAVRSIQDGLRAAVGELREFATDTSAVAGSGMSRLALTGFEAGHPAVASALEGFCERWDLGVASLVISTSGLAERLGIAAGSVWEEDQYRNGTFKVLVNAGIGNPHASEDEVEKKSMDAILSDHAFKRETPEQARQAREDFDRTWADTKHRVLNEGIGGGLLENVAEAQGMDRETLDHMRNPQVPGQHGTAHSGEQHGDEGAGSDGRR